MIVVNWPPLNSTCLITCNYQSWAVDFKTTDISQTTVPQSKRVCNQFTKWHLYEQEICCYEVGSTRVGGFMKMVTRQLFPVMRVQYSHAHTYAPRTSHTPHARTYTHIHIYTHIDKHTHIHTHIYTQAGTHARTHAHTHTRTHTHTHCWSMWVMMMSLL